MKLCNLVELYISGDVIHVEVLNTSLITYVKRVKNCSEYSLLERWLVH